MAVPVDIVLSFVTNENLAANDVVTVVLPGFGASRQSFNPTIESFSGLRRASWVCNVFRH